MSSGKKLEEVRARIDRMMIERDELCEEGKDLIEERLDVLRLFR